VGDGLIEHEVVDVFLAEATADLATPLNPEEVRAVEWIELTALCEAVRRSPEKYTPWLRIYLAEYMDRIFADLIEA
jgi:isopentenyl-diphosphate delta-isomerase